MTLGNSGRCGISYWARREFVTPSATHPPLKCELGSDRTDNSWGGDVEDPMEHKRCTSMLRCSSHYLQIQYGSLQKQDRPDGCSMFSMNGTFSMVGRSSMLTLQSLPVQEK